MDMFIGILLFIGILCVPIILGYLANGKMKKHNGSTACAACHYDLSGHDLSQAHLTGKCPECGCVLSENSVFRTGALYHKPASLWVAVPSIALLLVPPTMLAWVMLAFMLDMGRDFSAVIVSLAFPFVVFFAAKVSQRQSLDIAAKQHAHAFPSRQDSPDESNIRATMHIANYLQNQPPPPSPPA